MMKAHRIMLGVPILHLGLFVVAVLVSMAPSVAFITHPMSRLTPKTTHATAGKPNTKPMAAATVEEPTVALDADTGLETSAHTSDLPKVTHHTPAINEVGCDVEAFRHAFPTCKETVTPTQLRFVASPKNNEATTRAGYSTKSWIRENGANGILGRNDDETGTGDRLSSQESSSSYRVKSDTTHASDGRLLPNLPADFPSGTWFRNSAGRLVAENGEQVMHPFDGDGMVMAVTFDNDEAACHPPPNPFAKRRQKQQPQQQQRPKSRITFRNRYVQTEKYLEDQRTGGISGRGLFGTRKTGGFLANVGDMNISNVANTNCVLAPESNTLYALWEGGKPHALDPKTLDMKEKGESSMDGLLKEEDGIAAHFRYDPIKHTYVTFGTSFPDLVSQTTRVCLYELDADTFKPSNVIDRDAFDQQEHSPMTTSASSTLEQPKFFLNLPGVVLIHDFILTENYVVFTWVKAALDPFRTMKALLGFGAISGTMAIPEDSETVLLLIPRSMMAGSDLRPIDFTDDGNICIDALADDRITRIELPFSFNFHFGNGYETRASNGDRQLIFDMMRTSEDKDFDFAIHSSNNSNKPVWETLQPEDVPVGDMTRHIVNLDMKQLQEDPIVLCEQSPEFPAVPRHVSSRPHRYTYTLATNKKTPSHLSKPMWGAHSAITKIDATTPGKYETWSFDSDEFVGEPTMVRKQGADPDKEDACYVMTTVSKVSTGTTDIAIMDVEGEGALERGPVCRLRLPEFLPYSALHGAFHEGVVYDFD